MKRRIAVLILWLSVGLSCCRPSCKNDIWQEAAGPDGSQRAVFFIRSCGPLTQDLVMVSVLRAGEPVTGAGNAFKAGFGEAEAERSVRLEWTSADALRVSYDPRLRVFAAQGIVHGVRISYASPRLGE